MCFNLKAPIVKTSFFSKSKLLLNLHWHQIFSDIAFLAIDSKTTTMSVSGMVCIDKCTSYCSEYTNGSVDARQNVPYRVDRKSLSSYRRRHRSEPDSRTSSLYIGCVGCVILIMTVLFIIMLDFLPSAWLFFFLFPVVKQNDIHQAG